MTQLATLCDTVADDGIWQLGGVECVLDTTPIERLRKFVAHVPAECLCLRCGSVSCVLIGGGRGSSPDGDSWASRQSAGQGDQETGDSVTAG